MLQLANITFDAADPQRLAAFWSQATGRAVADAQPYFAQLAPDPSGTRMLFVQVPEGKSGKNRMHLDFHVADREAEIARLMGLGATRGETHTLYGLTWTVMQDPEGNEFCIAQE